MPYWKAEEIKIDCDGNEIKPGDILEQKELNAGNASWRYFVCYTSDGKTIEVRDLNANNVCMCDLGLQGDVRRKGHITEIYLQMENEKEWDGDDWGYYFSIKDPSYPYDSYGIDSMTEEEIAEVKRLNNFPEGWELKRNL